MTKWLDKILPSSFIYESRYHLFINALLCLVALQLLYFSPFLIEGSGFPSDPWTTEGIHKFFHLLELSSSTPLNFFFLGLALAAIVFQFKSKFKLLSSILLWFVYVNLINRLNAAETGANSLIVIFLFSNILYQYFVLVKSDVGKSMVFRMNQLQICLIYLVSSVYKFEGTSWMDGTALNELMSNPVYNLFYPNQLLPIWSKTAVYFILIYQLFFPLFIWFKKVKIPLVILGCAIHIGIMLIMGLFFFSSIMILTYLLWITPSILKS
jgi:hypothetical protein